MRRLFTAASAVGQGMSRGELRWGDAVGKWRRIVYSVYGDGPQAPSRLDIERATVLARQTVARGGLAGVLLELDSVCLDGRPTRKGRLPSDRVIDAGGIPCADGLQTLVDLAATLDDDTLEQALESALRKGLTTIEAIEAELPALGAARTPGTATIRRVLQRRPDGAPPTESLLETLAVQLARTVPGLGELTRQLVVNDRHGAFVARVDLSKPEIGLFFELDGQHHVGQPVYDAVRETAVVAATGWLPGRFTWYEIRHVPRSTARKMAGIAEQCHRRPLAS